ncbi:MAG TPA: hypothetical protein VF152_07655 [Acidimicrobiia bacterium]
MRSARIGLVVLATAALLAGSACDDAQDEAEETVEEVEEKAGEAGARAGAEAFRASLKAQETDDDAGGVRAIEPLRAAAEDVPGGADVTGITDSNGDGVDDDGYVQVEVGDERACVTLPETGDEIDVSGGACPAE